MRISEIFLLENLSIRASKINMALARMDKLVKKLMSNPDMTIHSPGLVEALQEKVAGLNCFSQCNYHTIVAIMAPSCIHAE
jgi:hypothetical protein